MSDTEKLAPYTPGPSERAALRMMNEIDYPTKRVGQHIFVQAINPATYVGYVWSQTKELWVESREIPVGSRAQLIGYLAERCTFDNVTITDHPIDLDQLREKGLERLDGFLGHGRITLCPEGRPGHPDGWCEVNTTLGEGGIANVWRFSPVQLKDRFVRKATPSNPTGQWNPNPLPHVPVLVRHDVAARELLPPRLWGIEGRPDLVGRQIDREVAVSAAVDEEAGRRWKAGDPTSIAAIRVEIGSRMEKEWERAA